MDWTIINHALLAHLPVASGLLLPIALLASQRPGRGIRNWWTVSRYLGWMGLMGLVAALVSGFLEAHRGGLFALFRILPGAWRLEGSQALLPRHAALALGSLPLAGLALWSMHRPRKDYDSLGLLTLLLGLLWAAALLATGRAGYRLAHGGKATSMMPTATPIPVPAAVPMAPPAPAPAPEGVPARLLDYGALEPVHPDPVKSPAHGGRWIRVWTSPDAEGAYRSGQPLPVGALVVMSTQEDRWGRPGPEAGPLYALEQTPAGPRFSFYWARIPQAQRASFNGETRAYRSGDDAVLAGCLACHAQGIANPALRSRWRPTRVSTSAD